MLLNVHMHMKDGVSGCLSFSFLSAIGSRQRHVKKNKSKNVPLGQPYLHARNKYLTAHLCGTLDFLVGSGLL